MKTYQRILTLLPAVLLLPVLAWAVLNQAAWLPRCHFNHFTGLHCTGCGMTRAVRALLQGDILMALRMNFLGVLLLPLVAFGLALEMLAWVLKRPALSIKLPGRWPTYLVATIITFTVLRNLQSFAFLAPL